MVKGFLHCPTSPGRLTNSLQPSCKADKQIPIQCLNISICCILRIDINQLLALICSKKLMILEMD